MLYLISHFFPQTRMAWRWYSSSEATSSCFHESESWSHLGMISTMTLILRIHWVKRVQIWSFFWSVFSCIQSEYRKIWTIKNSVFGQVSRSDKLTLKKFYLMKRSCEKYMANIALIRNIDNIRKTVIWEFKTLNLLSFNISENQRYFIYCPNGI